MFSTCPGANAAKPGATRAAPGAAADNVSNQTQGSSWEIRLASALGRIRQIESGETAAARTHHAVLAEQRRRRLDQLRRAPIGSAPSPGQLEEAFETLRARPPKFRRAEHLERLRRAVRRYERYGDCRPDGWPEGGVAAVVAAVERLRGWHGEELVTLGGVVLRFETHAQRRAPR